MGKTLDENVVKKKSILKTKILSKVTKSSKSITLKSLDTSIKSSRKTLRQPSKTKKMKKSSTLFKTKSDNTSLPSPETTNNSDDNETETEKLKRNFIERTVSFKQQFAAIMYRNIALKRKNLTRTMIVSYDEVSIFTID